MVAAPAVLRGESGVDHTFDLYAVGPDNFKILMETWVSLEMVDVDKVLSTYVKVLDVGPSKAFLAAIPGATFFAKELAHLYKIHLMEGVSTHEITSKFKEIVLTSSNGSSVLQ